MTDKHVSAVRKYTETEKERVKYHEAKLREGESVKSALGLSAGIRFSDDHNVQVWTIKESDALWIVCETPTLDDKVSRLSFGLSRQASTALFQLLGVQLGLIKQAGKKAEPPADGRE